MKLLNIFFVLFSLSVVQGDQLVAVQPVDVLTHTQLSFLKQKADFRGLFPSFGLIAVSDFEIVSQKLEKFFPTLSFTTVASFNQKSRCFAFDTLLHVPESNRLEDLVFCSNSESIDVDTDEWIPIPFKSLSKLPSSLDESTFGKYKETIFKKRDVISDAVSRVSREELYRNLEILSEDFHTRQSASDDILKAQEWAVNKLEDFGFEVSLFPFRDGFSDNIVAELKGSVSPDQYIIMGAHLDSRAQDVNDPFVRAPGADDNGSGSTALLEIARILTSSNVTFVYSIQLVLFSGEEQGLLGSDAYAKALRADGVDVVAMFNADMLGYRIPNSSISLGMKDRSITEWLLEASNIVTRTYVPELGIDSSSSCCSDYVSFYNAGYPAIGFFENPTTASTYPDYHKSTDVIENLDFDQMVLETQAVLASTMSFALPLTEDN